MKINTINTINKLHRNSLVEIHPTPRLGRGWNCNKALMLHPLPLDHDAAPLEQVAPPHPGQVLCLPLLPHLLLHLHHRLPPPSTQAGSVTDLVAPVQHAGHPGPQAGQGELHPELPLHPALLHGLLGGGEAGGPGQLVHSGGGHHVKRWCCLSSIRASGECSSDQSKANTVHCRHKECNSTVLPPCERLGKAFPAYPADLKKVRLWYKINFFVSFIYSL